MKRLIAAVFAIVLFLTFALLVALDSQRESPRTSAQAQPDSPVPTATPDPVAIAEALRGYELLRDLQVDAPAPEVLMAGGLEGVLTLVRGEATPPPALLPSMEGALEAALARLLGENPNVDPNEFTFAFIEGMVDALNERHTTFLRPESWNDLKDNHRPYLGYSATTVPEGRLVWQVDADSPADAAGLRPGDVIIAINEQSLASRGIGAVIGRTDFLTVRSADGRERVTSLTPAQVTAPIEGRLLTGGIAYLRIASFVPPGSSEVFREQLDAAMQNLTAASPIGWIIDLRSNGGGVVNLDLQHRIALLQCLRDLLDGLARVVMRLEMAVHNQRIAFGRRFVGADDLA